MTRAAAGALRVVHLPFTYYPDPIGGTEVYVQALVRELRKLGCEGVIAAPARAATAYAHDGIQVHRLAVSPNGLDLREFYGEGDPYVGAQFAELLDREEPNVVHMHAFTSAISLHIVRESARRGIPVLFTYHTPMVSCQRGTLMRWGRAVCDGQMKRQLCAQCTLHGLGLNRAASWSVGLLPPALGQLLGEMGWRSRLWTALRMGELTMLRHRAVRALWKEVDAIVALSRWTKDLLICNGVRPGKITTSHHGMPRSYQSAESRGLDRVAEIPLRLVYLGRLHPAKGVELLIRAIRALPTAELELDLYTIGQTPEDDRHRAHLAQSVSSDSRIRFLEPVPVERIRRTLKQYDVLTVPSQGMETGPLVVLEAFDAGIPVLGSALGGIAELVEHGVDGLLVDPWYELKAWTEAVGSLVAEAGAVGRLAQGVRPPRGMDDVAREMLVAYRGVLASTSRSK